MDTGPEMRATQRLLETRIAALEASLAALLRDHDRAEMGVTHIAATTTAEIKAARLLLGQT